MELVTGAMSSIIPKLGELLLEECKLKDSVKNGIEELKAELERMQAALVKISSVPLDKLDPQIKIWGNEVRELSYAIEDSLHSFVSRTDGVEPAKPKIKHLLKIIRNQCTKYKARHEIADDIKDIEIKVRKIKERYDRYKIEDVVANVATTTSDPRLKALYKKVSELVGTDGPIHEVRKVLSEGVHISEDNLKIVSIVGFGGLGKTTLAKVLKDKIGTRYQCQGFVPVGQNPDINKVLRDIIFELDMQLFRDAATMDQRQMINQLKKFLKEKRYFIVIDDIWEKSTWEMIKPAFEDSHPESRIIITTRIIDVATKVGHIYHMKPLSDDDSEMLFNMRTSVGEGETQDNQITEVIKKILKRCGGVPLAIITIASLLLGKQRKDWSKVYDAIGFGHEVSQDVQDTRKILSFSYYDLQPYLKPCLLYLGMYPEDKFIDKISLIWRWVYEGFVADNTGTEAFMLGEGYYNELVNRSLIREVESPMGEDGCRVHDLVLDVIRTMSKELNFVTVQDTRRSETAASPSGQSYRVHRLALHGVKVEHKPSIKMEHVRSFNAITCSDSGLPSFSICKVLRVLVIEECDFLEGHSLEHIGKLVQLRYLGLVNTNVKLPDRMGHDLKFLEVLDVRGDYIRELPPSVGELTNLRCLWADWGTRMKGAIGKLTCLEELQYVLVDTCPIFFTELGKLTKLRVLQIQLGQCDETAGKALAESLCQLHRIQILSISKPGVTQIKDLCKMELCVRGSSLEDLAPSSRLCCINLRSIIIPRMPSWIDSLCVPLLSYLFLYVEVVKARDLQALGRLPSLVSLVLVSEDEKRISYAFRGDEFHKLNRLVTNIEITIGGEALRRVEVLGYSASAGRNVSLVPWKNNCPLLSYVTCWLDCANSGRRDVMAAKAVLRKAKRTHANANNLCLDICIENYTGKAARLIDALSLILLGLERPDAEEIAADQRELRRMITSLETLLRDCEEPRVGRYGEQELRGFVTKFRSLLHDDAATDQEEEPDNNDAVDNDGSDTSTDEDSDDDDAGDNDDNEGDEDNTEQEEAGNDVATSSGTHEEGAVSLA